ncbi:MAG: hypothetical protein AB7G04_07415, partial [Hyphomonadaceae bacterium]
DAHADASSAKAPAQSNLFRMKPPTRTVLKTPLPRNTYASAGICKRVNRASGMRAAAAARREKMTMRRAANGARGATASRE